MSSGAEALDRKLRRGDPDATYDADALRVLEVVRKYWGDEAPIVLRIALEHAEREQ